MIVFSDGVRSAENGRWSESPKCDDFYKGADTAAESRKLNPVNVEYDALAKNLLKA